MMLAPITHILPLTTIRRERILPLPGRVVVRRGQKVSATDVIAEGRLHPEHMLLDICRGLGLPETQADTNLHCQAGDNVAKGDVLAGPVGFTRRVVRAPVNGKVVLAGGGQILLEVSKAPYELRAGLPGVVDELVNERGAIIETTGSLIQGVWGNGRIDYGLMMVLAHAPGEQLGTDRLDVSLRGSIVMAGICSHADVLQAAADLPLRGMILAGMDSALVHVAARMRYPILVLEGFGQRPMNSAAFKLLTTNDRREVAVNAEPWDRFSGTRPEIIIPLPSSGNPPPPREAEQFAPNQQVRVLRAPNAGEVGTLVQIMPGFTQLANGLKVRAGEVRLENGSLVMLPLANLEVLA